MVTLNRDDDVPFLCDWCWSQATHFVKVTEVISGDSRNMMVCMRCIQEVNANSKE